MARTPVGRRVRTAMGGGSATVATTVDYDGILGSETFDQDVRIIGYYLRNSTVLLDAHSNADGMIHSYIELSRHATRAGDGFGRLPASTVWNAAIVIGGSYDTFATVFFPEGYGIDIDEGESVNLLGYMEWIGAGGDIAFWGEYILYYVER